MVGNSLRSDVLPVLALGGWAVHVPAALSWSHEHADRPAASEHFFEVSALAAVPPLIRTPIPAAPGARGRAGTP